MNWYKGYLRIRGTQKQIMSFIENELLASVEVVPPSTNDETTFTFLKTGTLAASVLVSKVWFD